MWTLVTVSSSSYCADWKHTCQSWKLNLTIQLLLQLFNYLREGRSRSWKVRVEVRGYGDEAGKRKKEQTRMCNSSPYPSRSSGWEGWWDYACLSVLFSSSLLRPRTPNTPSPLYRSLPLTPSPFKISSYFHLNSWIIE